MSASNIQGEHGSGPRRAGGPPTGPRNGPYGYHHHGAHDGHGVAGLAHGVEQMQLGPSRFGTNINPHYMPHSPAFVDNAPGGVSIPPQAYHQPMYYPPTYPYMGQVPYQYGHGNLDPGQVHRVPSSSSGNVPALSQRRSGSLSSEEHAPGTPGHYQYYSGGVAIMDRSPSAVFTNNTTPSPQSYTFGPHVHDNNTLHGSSSVKAYAPPIVLPPKLVALIRKEPALPRAVPAPNSPMKSLDRCLENKNGETNVYIRGLSPETSDAMLQSYGERFGDIASSKSIIDHKTSLCKGFGFIKFHNFDDAEDCIRAFHSQGYEVSFARESFYSKLKKFSDEGNTNLYVSNIPRNLNEHELASLFDPFPVMSARILRDENGNGRGVGFARFENRHVCEEVVRTMNNKTIHRNDGDYLIQIRYSDTAEQKLLKQQTAAARLFRAAEFEAGCAQIGRILPSPHQRNYVAGPSHGGYIHDREYNVQTPTHNGQSHYRGTPATAQRTPLPTINSEQSLSPQTMAPPTVRIQEADDSEKPVPVPAAAGAEQE